LYIIFFPQGKIYLWIGANSAAHVAELGREAARRLAASQRPPPEMGPTGSLALTIIEDGAEAANSSRSEFWDALRGTRDAFRNLSSGEQHIIFEQNNRDTGHWCWYANGGKKGLNIGIYQLKDFEYRYHVKVMLRFIIIFKSFLCVMSFDTTY
jgi:hypothetical protein